MIPFTESASANPFQSPVNESSELIDQLIRVIVAADILENVEVSERLLNEHRDILFSCLAKPDAMVLQKAGGLGVWLVAAISGFIVVGIRFRRKNPCAFCRY